MLYFKTKTTFYNLFIYPSRAPWKRLERIVICPDDDDLSSRARKTVAECHRRRGIGVTLSRVVIPLRTRARPLKIRHLKTSAIILVYRNRDLSSPISIYLSILCFKFLQIRLRFKPRKVSNYIIILYTSDRHNRLTQSVVFSE